jgi:hypothetical protein
MKISEYVETPSGIGRFVYYDHVNQIVVVEMDYSYLVKFPADKCYVIFE